MSRSPHQKTGYLKNATVLLLTVAFLFGTMGQGRGLSASAAEEGARETIVEGLVACAEVVDLSGYGLSVEAFGTLYREILLDSPELFHVAPRLSYVTEAAGEGERRVKEIYPQYTLSGEELTAARAFYRDTVAGLIFEMEAVFSGGAYTEAEAVLWLHDVLAHRYVYDTRPDAAAAADAYRFFREGRGLCQAYALAFLALCRGVGLEADLVVSEAMDHAWNHVRVEGVWYHVDVTRDDPVPAEGGREAVHHTRFLRSDQGMDALGYRDYACGAGHTCTDTRFEMSDGGRLDVFWTPLTRISTGWVGVDDGGSLVGVKFTENGVFVGQVGDVNLDGSTDPADVLALYDPTMPEAWREWMRERLVRSPIPVLFSEPCPISIHKERPRRETTAGNGQFSLSKSAWNAAVCRIPSKQGSHISRFRSSIQPSSGCREAVALFRKILV